MSPATTYFSVTRFSFSIREKRISCVHYVKQLSSNYSQKPYVFLPTMSNRLVTPCHLCTRYTKREGRWNPIKDDSGRYLFHSLHLGLLQLLQLTNAIQKNEGKKM
ncbi:hypothetical protein OUZ56_013775 [Daphnia magna]|uniref:Uncharacterized protein n=1 Tax=Daphnia magna TaxID=35525 RepID=A0ABQ9Z6W8_9CRUS|nr:hypothetical protein OUZ56_013775 [Daphnia magna]